MNLCGLFVTPHDRLLFGTVCDRYDETEAIVCRSRTRRLAENAGDGP